MVVVLPWSRFDSDWFPWSSNGKSKIQPVTKCQCPVTGPGTPLHLLNWPVHHQILIFRSLPLLTLIVSIFAEREWRATFWEMSTAANRVAIFLSSVLCSFQKCTWPKIAEDTVTHWSRIVPIIASIFLIDSVNPVSNPQMVQRRGLWYQVGKAPRSRHRLLRRGKIWGFCKIGRSNAACNLWSTFTV